MTRIPIGELVRFGGELLRAKGVPEDDARYAAEVAVTAEAMGINTHGLALLAYLEANLGKEILPDAQPRIKAEKTASVLIDGNRSLGQTTMRLACEKAAEKARQAGIGMAAASNTFWLGALAPYLLPLARQGLMAHAWAQTSTCKDCAPYGGVDARFSTNPVALAFPTGNGPVLADFSTAAVAMGKVNRWIREGKRAPEPFFLDPRGRPTDDPAVVKEGGSIRFSGGHKGYALSLWCEALTALAAGSCNNPQAPSRQSFSVLAIDPEAFAGAEYYLGEMRRFVAHLRTSRTRPGFEKIRLPGERALEALARAEEEGVPVEEEMLGRLSAMAARNGIAPPAA